jgi:hypothetical protein
MIQPKINGGLGFRNLRLFNRALLARQAWRLLLYPDSLCARLLKAKYYQGEFVRYCFWWKHFSHMAFSYVWTGAVKKGIIQRIGNGCNIQIWRDNWIPR